MEEKLLRVQKELQTVSNSISEAKMDGYDLELALTYDDVLLRPKKSVVLSRRDTDVSTRLTKNLKLNIPVIAANMDTVCESQMAIALAQEGGIGFVHRFLTIERQVEEVLKVKRAESFIVEDPVTISFTASVKDVKKLMEKQGVSGILVLNPTGKLVGIVTQRDLIFVEDFTLPVGEIMTPEERLITAPLGTTLDEAKKILNKYKIEKLPLVDQEFRPKALITSRDILNMSAFPWSAKDKKGRLLVGAAVGVKHDYIERAEALLHAGADVIVVDIAHGHSLLALNAIKELRKKLGEKFELIAGNVATAEGTKELIEAGANGIKIGVGPGATCITRIVTGFGVPQLSAVLDCAKAADKYDIPVIADGGIRFPGDVTKALAAGASTVMMGSVFAGTEETPGIPIVRKGAKYKIYRGMASFMASVDRRGTENISGRD
ncbi:MAG: IMP dehydrogenase, partial [Candidatus Diapherotrites archaeon]|nr:IMP dehydrogenase [Candidatus Diapherotrites archaeon]